MKFWVGITDADWYLHLQAVRPDEVNFWQPSAARLPVLLNEGQPFLFKLHADRGGTIVGGGFVAHHTKLPVRLAWDAFGEKNGAATLEEMTARISRYRSAPVDPEVHEIGCYLLAEPFFFDHGGAVPRPPDWPRTGVQQGKTYDTATQPGLELWQSVQQARILAGTPGVAEDVGRYGEPVLVARRLGQGTFRSMVTDAYARRCAITAERTLPVLEAAHIKPYGSDGPHAVDNGLLLRADLHTLFDRGYVTVTPDGTVRVSPRIRAEWENGRDYYALDGRSISLPIGPYSPPRREYLEWHGDMVFRS